ncbi:MAG: class I SAM-dependent methyltransferase [Candidatus Zixiibacteriota bacterium]|nr:MAG: class I SAM-dependent methyltransferase [candidate division Zixibacteria bacterium]
MPTVEEKKAYFDQYWRDQPESKADPRSIQRAEYVHKLVQKTSGRLLDVGCGRGVILDYFAQLGYEVAGTDISPDAVTMVSENGHKAFLLDIERDEPEGKYDIILCLEVLQQVYYPLRALKRLKDALEYDGELIVSLPNEFHIVSRLKILFGRTHVGHFNHSHIRLFSPERDLYLFERLNLRVAERAYIPVVPPRWKSLTALFRPLARMFPALFAIASVYCLRKS